MTKTKLVLTASVGALIFGVAGYAAAASEQHDVIAKHRIVVAADDSAAGDDSGAADDSAAGDDDANSDGSAKMGAGRRHVCRRGSGFCAGKRHGQDRSARA